MATVQLQQIRLSFDKTEIIKGVDLTLQDKELTVFVGPSGCGKSTLLRLIAGLEEITSGDLLIDGQRVNDIAPAKRGLALVFQSYALYPHMTVAENMAFSLKLAGMPKAERDQKVEAAARILSLESFLGRKPKDLSGGQRQRVAIGRAIVRNPKVFLFDEPLSNLDAALRVRTRLELSKLHKQLQATMIYVTHDQVEAMTMGDRVAVLRDGKLQQYATPSELYDHPVNSFVAGFIGSPAMNLMDLSRTASGVSLGDVDLPLRREVADAAGSRERLTVGLRPEDWTLDSGEGSLKVVIDVVEELGSESYLYGHMSEDDSTTLVVRGPGRTAVRHGETIAIRPDADALHLFDAESGERLVA